VKIEFTKCTSSRLYFGRVYVASSFCTKNNKQAYLITVGKGSPTWQMDFCHEVAHALTTSRFNLSGIFGFNADHRGTFRWEVVSWRLAKSFCKEKYWNEARALRALKGYAKALLIKVDWKKFKLIELNKGITLRRKDG